ncbi:MAG: hypothetical protein ACLGH0_07465, partial [Thermoanaerobaculia bacterium]
MRRRERRAAENERRRLLSAQPFQRGGERHEVPVAVAAIHLRKGSIALARRLVDVRLHFPQQRDIARAVEGARGLTDGSGNRVLLPRRLADRNRIRKLGCNEIE